MTTPAHIRETIAEALQDADALGEVGAELLQDFEDGAADIPFTKLGLDSLARMELLVALETEHNTVVLPSTFAGFSSLEDIVAHVDAPNGALPSSSPGHGPGQVPGHGIGNEAAAEPAPSANAQRPRVVRLFQRAVSHCATAAEMQLLLSHIADRGCPLDVATLSSWHQQARALPPGAPEKFGAVLSDWLAGTGRAMARSGRREPEAFTGRRLAPAAMLYSGPGAPGDKGLLVCFSVKGSRSLSISQTMFLQHVDAEHYDVLLLYDLWDTAFRGGLPGIGRSVREVVDWVAELDLIRQYARVRTVGCSAGVYPAMLTGRRIGAELVVGINGRFPSERHMKALLGMYFHAWRSARRRGGVPVLLTHGTTRSRDVAFAKRLRWLTGTSQLAVDMPGRDLRHNVLPPLLENGELKDFFERTVFADPQSEQFTHKAHSAMTYPAERPATAHNAP